MYPLEIVLPYMTANSSMTDFAILKLEKLWIEIDSKLVSLAFNSPQAMDFLLTHIYKEEY
jgi:hypothetical protein